MTYSSGYDDSLIQQLQRRKVTQSAGFFLPHLKPEMRLLDCGCGPGTLTAGFAHNVAQVVGLDIEPGQATLARRDHRGKSLHFAVGSAYGLPFERASFDAVFAHAMLYHLPKPEHALREMHRVLKPGGLIGIRDSDFGGTLLYPENPLVKRGIEMLGKVIESHGGDPHFGRRQRAILRTVGFKNVRVSASFDIFSARDEIGGFCEYIVRHLTREQIASALIAGGWTTQGELHSIANALTVWREHPDALAMVCRCEAVASA